MTVVKASSRDIVALTTASASGEGPDTFPRLLVEHARRNPGGVALQEKRYGVWQPMTWLEYHDHVRDFAHGLDLLGVGEDDVVGVLGDNRPEWLIAELAAEAVGAAVVGIYPTSVGDEIVHILTTARVQVVVAEDQEQVDKLLRLRDRLPNLRVVVYYDPRGLEVYDDDLLREFVDVEALGAQDRINRTTWFDERVAAGRSSDTAVICTTSGTTSRPKLAILSHDNLLSMAARLLELDPLKADDRYMSALPFAWIGEQMLTVAVGMTAGFTVSFPEAADTTRSDMREIGPNVMFGPPPIWESMVSDVQVRLAEAGWLKRMVFAWGQQVGERTARRRVKGEGSPWYERGVMALADLVALRPVREQLGLSRLRRAYTGGAPLGPDVFGFFQALRINLKQIYGQTEICGIAVVHPDDDVQFNTVGRPIPGTELRIADDGEILLRSGAVFQGYLDNPDATAEAVDAEGWLNTGDAGYLDDGHLVVIDRAKDVRRAPTGDLFSPAFIENKLKFSPFVEAAIVFGGEDDAGITAILTIDGQTVGSWAERRHLSYTTYTDLCQKPEVHELLAEEVFRANEDLPESIRVVRFVVLHKAFDADDDEITRTRKVRRDVVADRYRDIVTALENRAASVIIHTTVTYQDGTRSDRELELAVRSLDGFVPAPRRRRGLGGRVA